MSGGDADEPLTSEGARALAEALFTGTAGPAWAARHKRHLKLLRAVWGPDGSGLQPIREPPHLDGPIVARPQTRRVLDPLARRLLEAFIEGDVERLIAHLDPQVWALWPDGAFGRFEGKAIIEHLRQRPHERTYLTPSKPFAYGAGDARTNFALGIPEALDELFNLRSVLIYTFALDQYGRVMIALRPYGESGRLVALPLPSIDDARAYSVRVSTDEHEGARVADRFVRHALLGHGPALASMNNELMTNLMVWLVVGDKVTQFNRLKQLGLGTPVLLN